MAERTCDASSKYVFRSEFRRFVIIVHNYRIWFLLWRFTYLELFLKFNDVRLERLAAVRHFYYHWYQFQLRQINLTWTNQHCLCRGASRRVNEFHFAMLKMLPLHNSLCFVRFSVHSHESSVNVFVWVMNEFRDAKCSSSGGIRAHTHKRKYLNFQTLPQYFSTRWKLMK